MILAGAGGTGKTQLVKETLFECALEEGERQTSRAVWLEHHKVSCVQLLNDLYMYRGKEDVIIFDDMDRMFDDPEIIEILNGALENDCERLVRAAPADKFPNIEPNPFPYEGKIIFITNDSVPQMIRMKPRLGRHISALATRVFYHDLGVYTQDQKLANVYRYIKKGMLDDLGLASAQIVELARWLHKHKREMSIGLRGVLRIARLIKDNPVDWKSLGLSSHRVPEPPDRRETKAF
jgi:hypothetical protein